MLNLYTKLIRFSSKVIKEGEGFHLRYHLQENGKTKSFWHDVPLKTDKSDEFNIVIEIPRYPII